MTSLDSIIFKLQTIRRDAFNLHQVDMLTFSGETPKITASFTDYKNACCKLALSLIGIQSSKQNIECLKREIAFLEKKGSVSDE